MKDKQSKSQPNRKVSRHKKVKCPEENCHYIGRRSYIKAYHYPNAHPDLSCSLSESAISSQSSKRIVEKTKQKVQVKKNIFQVSKHEEIKTSKHPEKAALSQSTLNSFAGLKFYTVAIDERESSDPVKHFKEFEEQYSDESHHSESSPQIIRDIPWNVPYFVPEWNPPKKKDAQTPIQRGLKNNGKSEKASFSATKKKLNFSPSKQQQIGVLPDDSLNTSKVSMGGQDHQKDKKFHELNKRNIPTSVKSLKDDKISKISCTSEQEGQLQFLQQFFTLEDPQLHSQQPRIFDMKRGQDFQPANSSAYQQRDTKFIPPSSCIVITFSNGAKSNDRQQFVEIVDWKPYRGKEILLEKLSQAIKKLLLKEVLSRHILNLQDLECDKLFQLAVKRKRAYSE